MKTVTGGVIAAEPISLPKAATILSSFVSSKNGASQDVGAYLRRASAAFSELRSFHGELKSSPLKETQIGSDVTHERNQDLKGEINEERKKKKKSEESIEDDESVVVGKVKEKLKTCEKSVGVEVENEKERRKEKKKKRKSGKEMHSVEKKSRAKEN
ncbi:unnamed protein product [Microthlaspi erraticum]|uniref:Uncharacterized protein n=1 Tax=Microthlaspi erraticum TaxID=1685480 RepID=A0A6D2IQ40_9BRAS|nr:unnamed protein product [Microthlaspi erraticum]